MNTNKPFSRLMALVLSAVLMLSGLPVTAFAAETGGCAHEHNEECGYTEAAPCLHDHDEDCGGLSLGVSGNVATPTNAVIVTAFDELADEVIWQGYDYGTVTSPAALTLPDTLTGTDTDDNPITIEGITWQSAPAFDPEVSAEYLFSPTLPEGYALAEDVTAPVISVSIRPEGGVGIMPMAADIWDGSAVTPFTGGGASAGDPYLIATGAQLAYLAQQVNAGTTYAGKFFELAGDIDLNNKPWTRIGNSSANSFQGVFDGKGHTISNLKITGSASYSGLFGYVKDGTIKNVGLSGVDIICNGSSGGIAGMLEKTASGTAVIENCFVSGRIEGSAMNVGGIVGYSSGATVQNCYSNVDVKSTDRVGGIVGYVNNTTVIDSCYATGKIEATDGSAGGIAGYAMGAVRNCVALNKSIIGASEYEAYRIMGSGNGAFENNHAWSMMPVNYAAATTGINAAYLNGANITATDLKTASKWPAAFASTPWSHTNNELPILTGFSAGQDSAFPAHVTDSEPISANAKLATVAGQAINAGNEAGTAAAPKKASISVLFGKAAIDLSDIIPADTNAAAALYSDSNFTVQQSTVSLNEGANKIYIKVTAQDTVTELYYEVTVTRAVSSDATIASVAGQTINAGSEAGTTAAPKKASISVANNVSSITTGDIFLTDTYATFRMYSDAGFSLNENAAINLTIGMPAHVYLKVTAQNNTTVLYYDVTVTRNEKEEITVNETPETTTVIYMGTYNGSPAPWYVIGADATSWTLLAKGAMGVAQYHASSNAYSTSRLKTEVEALLSGFGPEEKNAMADVNLTDVSVAGQKLWPLSFGQASGVNIALRSINGNWWLRTPVADSIYVSIIEGDGSFGTSQVLNGIGVRPGFQLKLASVLCMSEADGAAPAGADTALTRLDAQELKLTLSNNQSSLNGFSVTSPGSVTKNTEETVPVSYGYTSGAQGGEFLRVRLTQGGKTIYQGVIAANLSGSGTAQLPLTGVNAGTYSASVWVEKAGAAYYSNIGCEPVTFQLTVTKATQTAPNEPTLSEKSDTTVTLNEISGAKYAKSANSTAPAIPGTGQWQDSNEFTGLSANTTYYFFAYYPETGTHDASSASTGLSVKTDFTKAVTPAQPTTGSVTAVGFKITNSYDTSTYGSLEYQVKSSGAWDGIWTMYNDTNGITGLTPNTAYTVRVRFAGDNITYSAGDPSNEATVTTAKAALGGVVTITGSYVYGQTLNAVTVGLNSTPSVALGTLSYQWTRGGTNIGSATGASYTLTAADINAVINVTVTAANCDGSVSSTNSTATVKATPTANDLDFTLTGVNYNGSQRTVSVTAKSGVTGLGNITVQYDSGAAPTNAGTYAITVDIAEGTNYSAVTGLMLGNFTINKIAPTANDLTYTLPATVDFNGSPQSVSIVTKASVTGLGNITVKYNGSATAPTNAGTYSITAEIAAGTNYLATTTDFTLGTFTINGIDIPAGDITVTPYSGTYNGAAHSISVSDSGGGTVTYCDTLNGTYTATNPTYTNADTYTVYYKVTRAGGNYNPFSGSSTVTINKAALTITGAAISTKTYDGNTDATVTGVTFSGNVGTLALGTDFTATGAFNSANVATANTVTVTVTLGSTAIANNHSLSISNFNLTSQSIAQATGSFGSPAAVNTTYTTTLTLANLTIPTGYSWGTPSTALSAGDGQSYAATYTDINGNYTTASGNITVNVAKANQIAPAAPSLSSKDATSITLNTIPGAEYRLSTGTWQDAPSFTGLNPGTSYTFYARLKETANYNASSESDSAAIATDKAALGGAVTISGTEKYGDTLTAVTSGLTSTPNGALGTLTYQWKRGGTDISGATNNTYALQSADISQTITLTVTAANCNGEVTSDPTGAISKATPAALTWPTAATITYGAALSTSTLGGGSTTGTWTWTNGATIPTVTNSGYEVTFTPTDTVNYDWTGVTVKQNVAITVNKATPAALTWPTAAAITYGTALSTSTLSGGSTSGTFVWTAPATLPTVVNSGYGVTFTPTDTDNFNWTGVTMTGTVSISVSPKPITITPDAGQSKVYSTNDPTFTYTPSETLLTGNSFSGALSREAGVNVGTYTYTIGTLSAGSNYTLSLAAETFEITKAAANAVNSAKSVLYSDTAAQTVDIAALVSNQKLAGDTLSYSVGTVTGTDSGVIAGPTVAINGTLSFTITGGANGNTATIPVTVSGFTNYNPITVNVNVTLTNKTGVTISGITANQSLAYNGVAKDVVKTNANVGAASVSNLSYSYEGMGATTYGPSATAPTNAGDYKCTVTLTDAAYFADDFVINFTITKATITITAENKTALAGGSEPSYTYTISGLVSGETLATLPTVTCPTANMNTAGTYPITAYGAAAPAGDNYNNIVYVNGTLTVTNLPTYTVTFDLAGGTHTGGGALSQTVASGGAATAPTTTRSGYTFTGWDKAFANVTANMTVTARWTYNGGGNGGNTGGDSGSSGGTPVTPPTNPGSTTITGDVNGEKVNITQDKDTGAVSTTVTAAEAQKALETAKTTGEVTITIPKTDTITSETPVEATVSKEAFAAIADSGAVLKLDAPAVTITFDTDAVSAIAGAGNGDVKISAGLADSKNLNAEQKNIAGDRPVYDFSVTVGGKAVNEFGGDVTITLPYTPKQGEDVNAIVIYYLDANGSVKTIPGGVYDPATGTVKFVTDHFSLYMIGYNAKTFTDVNKTHWASGFITFVAARGIFNGDNGQFAPDGSMTRAMFAQVLANFEGADLSVYKTSRFSDVAVGQWYAAAVEWAASKGIVNGYDGRFDPNTSITREQMAVMLYNYMKYKGYAIPSGTASAFADENSISSWAYEAVKVIQKVGIVSGKPGNLYDPQATATRAEVATLFTNFVKHVAGVTTTGNKTAANNTMSANTILAMLPGKEDEFTPVDENGGEKEV